MAKDEKKEIAGDDDDKPEAKASSEAKSSDADKLEAESSDDKPEVKAEATKASDDADAEPKAEAKAAKSDDDAEPEAEPKAEAKKADAKKADSKKAAKSDEEEAPKAEAKKADAKKADSKKSGKKSDKKADKTATPAKAAAREHDDHGHAAEGAHAAHGHHAVNRKQIWTIFGVLFALTVLEVAVAQVPGISHTLMAIALVALAVTKAACVGLYYMHLKGESKILRASVAIPFAAPVVYALVLISDATWRLAR